MPTLELAAFTPTAATTNALLAPTSASRIELSTNRLSDGLTPSKASILALTNHSPPLTARIRILIRPHARDFTYSDEEMRTMCEDVKLCGSLKVDGVVFGVLSHDEDGGKGRKRVDRQRCKILLAVAAEGGLSSVFHRAFDQIAVDDMEDELEALIELGFAGVLTSGGAKSALEGKEVLRRLVERAAGRIEVIVGGGVRSGNVGELVEYTKATAFHSSAVLDDGEDPDEEEIRKLAANLVKYH